MFKSILKSMETNFIKVRTRLILDPRIDIEKKHNSEINNFSSNLFLLIKLLSLSTISSQLHS